MSRNNRKHPAINVAWNLWTGYRGTILWYWVIFIIIYVLVNLLLKGTVLSDEQFGTAGIWFGSSNSPKIFLLVIGILLTPLSLASFVACGVTRKHFVAGSVIMMAGLSLLFALIHLAGYPVERLIADLSGSAQHLEHPPLLSYGIENLFLFFGYYCCGWLIGSGFYRYNWRIGIIICLAAIIPIVLMELVSQYSFVRDRIFETSTNGPLPFGAAAAILLFLTLLVTVLNYLMLRTVAIKRKLV